MSIEIVFETRALSGDNERGIATRWLPGRLCERGRANAADLPTRWAGRRVLLIGHLATHRAGPGRGELRVAGRGLGVPARVIMRPAG
jgi:hypothetical protein